MLSPKEGNLSVTISLRKSLILTVKYLHVHFCWWLLMNWEMTPLTTCPSEARPQREIKKMSFHLLSLTCFLQGWAPRLGNCDSPISARGNKTYMAVTNPDLMNQNLWGEILAATFFLSPPLSTQILLRHTALLTAPLFNSLLSPVKPSSTSRRSVSYWDCWYDDTKSITYGAVVGMILLPTKDVYVLIPGICACVTSYGKRSFAD